MKKLLSLLLIASICFGVIFNPNIVVAEYNGLKPIWNNIYWLAKTMYAENSSGTDETVILTGIVICQRVRADSYPDSIYNVISQRGQYSTWGHKKYNLVNQMKDVSRLLRKYCDISFIRNIHII